MNHIIYSQIINKIQLTMPRVEIKNLSIKDICDKLELEGDIFPGEQVIINPSFQRGDEETGVWSKKNKQYYIDSLIQSYPTGIITFVKDYSTAVSYQNPWSCLDGGNRLRAIRDFVTEKIATLGNDPIGNKLFLELSANEQAVFLAKSIPCQWITVTHSDPTTTIADMFTRLNTTAKPLSPGELIKAHGWKLNVEIIELAKKFIGDTWQSTYSSEHIDIDTLRNKWMSVFCRETLSPLEETRRCDSIAMFTGYIISAITEEFWCFDKRYERIKCHLDNELTEEKLKSLGEKLHLFLDIMSEAYTREIFGSPTKGIPSRNKVAVVWKKICEGTMTPNLVEAMKHFYRNVVDDDELLSGYNAILQEGSNGETSDGKMRVLIQYIEEWYLEYNN